MWTAPDVIAAVLGAAGLAWAILSWFIARAAAGDAADARMRAASALEVANELTKKMLEPPPPPWTLEFAQPNGWQLANHTGHVADDVFIESLGDEFAEGASTWHGVQPGDIIPLQAVKPFEYATVVVHFSNGQSHKITVEKPRSGDHNSWR